ncbi:MAG: PilZ domain-containing protein [Acidobacteriota bacterium]|nr:MAG: PilZ domain-containing protein [Acidobacteriota bacterium]
MAGIDLTDARTESERRVSDRKKLIIDVEFEGGDGTGIANTRDIGAGGLYMTTSTVLDTGSRISMKLSIDQREMNLFGVVVYSDPGHGVGVRFHGISEDDEKFLAENLGLN